MPAPQPAASDPRRILDDYRRTAPPFLREEAAAFNAMSVPDRLEFLYWSLVNITNDMARLHAMTQRASAPVQ
jgi:hypothetical protein